MAAIPCLSDVHDLVSCNWPSKCFCKNYRGVCGTEELLLMGTGLLFCKMENVLRIDGGAGCTAM